MTLKKGHKRAKKVTPKGHAEKSVIFQSHVPSLAPLLVLKNTTAET